MDKAISPEPRISEMPPGRSTSQRDQPSCRTRCSFCPTPLLTPPIARLGCSVQNLPCPRRILRTPPRCTSIATSDLALCLFPSLVVSSSGILACVVYLGRWGSISGPSTRPEDREAISAPFNLESVSERVRKERRSMEPVMRQTTST